MSGTQRRGVSLVELLTAVAIIAVLIGLLLPAVQKVRGTAARISCSNNVKQISLVLHMYHDSLDQLPPAVRLGPSPDAMPFLSWRGRLLPFVEQETLWDDTRLAYRAYRTRQDPFFEATYLGREQVLRVFICPSDGRVSSVWEVTAFGLHVRTAMSSYLGVAGTDSGRRDGIFYLDSAVRLIDLLDGSSQTLMIGERPPSTDLFFGWWYVGAGQAQSGSADADLGVREINRSGRLYHGCDRGPYTFKPRDLQDHCAAFGYWSPHPGGANFAFADGSVRFLQYTADPIMPALATRAGGETAPSLD
jgi:prepilin-type processing-associated H-X9-DG protein/prepilin-type N-terminal cleavage/methylation domain-containing protein